MRRMVLAAAVLLIPATASAQELDGDDGTDRDRVERTLRDRGTQALYKMADQMHAVRSRTSPHTFGLRTTVTPSPRTKRAYAEPPLFHSPIHDR